MGYIAPQSPSEVMPSGGDLLQNPIEAYRLGQGEGGGDPVSCAIDLGF